MPHKILRMHRTEPARDAAPRRPVMLAIAGDSAAGKTTITSGLVRALGPEQCTAVCVDDYHRYDRQERKELEYTALHPDCNYVDIMEQHLQLLATGHPILKPVYDHRTGQLTRPEYVEPRKFVIVEGLLPLHTKLAAACFDVAVYLNPPEAIRRDWKIKRDTGQRGYTREQVLAELERREPESDAFIRPQRRRADIVVRFAPVRQRHDPPGTPLSAELLLRPTIRHPDLSGILAGSSDSMHLKLTRDEDGRPVDALHIHGYAPPEDSRVLEKAIWAGLGEKADLPETMGAVDGSQRSEPLAITQLLLLYHLIEATR
jgi:phosphoribulokinase